jgi:hypothetical protein
MILKEVIKKEEVREREVSLPFYYMGHDSVGTIYVKLVDEEKAITVRTPNEINGRIAAISVTSPSIATNTYPVDLPITAGAWEDMFWTTELFLKKLAVPEYILSDEERDEFPHTY